MGQFVDGDWQPVGYKSGEDGSFQRPPTTFRKQIVDLQDDRYHLYASWACPWAQRVLIARSVLGLQKKLSVSYLDWFLDDDGWRFHPEHEGSTVDHLFAFDRLRHVYKRSDSHYTGRVTVPVLWDRRENCIVNNESRVILRMLCERLRPWHRPGAPDLSPSAHRLAIDETLDAIYEPINSGVYKVGFATTQGAYDNAVTRLFEELEGWERHLQTTDFLVGDQFSEADICLFTTLLRFDPVYHTHFKCSLRMISEYPRLNAYLQRIYGQLGVAETCRLDHIVNHYYRSHTSINPSGIVARTPASFPLDASRLSKVVSSSALEEG